MPTSDEYKSLCKLLQQTCGLVLGPDKKYLIRTRLQPILVRHHLKSYSELLAKASATTVPPLSAAPSSAASLRMEIVEAMTTKETSFFRDGHPFEEFERTLLPETCARAMNRTQKLGGLLPKIRIWSAACATGQEPYSICICIHEYFSKAPLARWNADHFWVFATDISSEAIATAKTGEFSAFDVSRGLSLPLRNQYFESKHADRWQAKQSLRKMIDFQVMNITESQTGLSGFDIVFCRNLLIYFDEPTRNKVLETIHQAMLPQGTLILGSAENLPSAAQKLFTARPVGRSLVFTRVP